MDQNSVKRFSRIHHNTPEVVVVNNLGLAVRQLAYCREEAEEVAQLRISLQTYDTVGYLKRSVDARLSKAYLKNATSSFPNQTQINTLSGAVLQSKNVDAGLRISISDVRGLRLWTNNSLGNERTFDYDTLGRVTNVSEKTPGKKALCCERFIYGDKTSKAVNGVGRLLKHYDSAGLREIKSYSVLGNILRESRQFLANTIDVDWLEDLTERQKLLEAESYTTQWEYNGLGETLRQTDAKGNQQSTQYGLAGEFVSSSLQLKAGVEQAVISQQTYSAAGQLLEKRLANGVIIQYSYEEKTQRLHCLHSVRLSDNKLLQDLNYYYDPIGNILEIIDKATEPSFYANEKTEAVSQYRYDSLYQLIEAKGVESQHAAKESVTQNPALRLGNPDASRCVNYTRSYEYDAGGNLYAIQHRGAQNYTRDLQIAANSNRGIEKRDSGSNLIESFDANGNLLYLNTDQPLQWDSCNQLQQVVQLNRETYSDEEQYRYDASGQRVEKLTQRLAQEQIHSDRVRYLPGLELREHWQTDREGQNKKVTEQLQVIQQGGVRVLHWETGKPDEIENDGLRYILTDQLGSSQLELNAKGKIINYERYYPYGGTAIWATKNTIEASYQFIRYSGKEQDSTGLYYYGYRYYLPWLGRWLNPDPAGISDGLNLFKMAYNNPIVFYDSDGRAPIESNYHSWRGDLIYGLGTEQYNYIDRVFFDFKVLNRSHPPLVIGVYNNAISSAIIEESAKHLPSMNYLADILKRNPENIDVIKVPKNIKKLASQSLTSNYKFLWDEYFSIGEENKKFNIAEIYKETAREYGSSKYHKWIIRLEDPTELTTKLLWKRGSKLGIEIIAKNNQAHLHFILDSLDIEAIVYKLGQSGTSITASELRYIYRNWHRLAGKVYFYRNNVEVEAPWEQHRLLWARYQPKRERAMRREDVTLATSGMSQLRLRTLQRYNETI
jgi:insecticidal toxin complex protein TccC